MNAEGNPHESPESCSPERISDESTQPLWPMRLTVGLILCAGTMFLAFSALQLSRSSNIHDRTIGLYDALLSLMPFAVLVPGLFVSTLRLAESNRAARTASAIGLFLFLAFVAWSYWVWKNSGW